MQTVLNHHTFMVQMRDWGMTISFFHTINCHVIGEAIQYAGADTEGYGGMGRYPPPFYKENK